MTAATLRIPQALFKPSTCDLATARSCTLGQRLRPEWQDEDVLLHGLPNPNIQFFMVTNAGLAQRRRIGGTGQGMKVRWQLRLSP